MYFVVAAIEQDTYAVRGAQVDFASGTVTYEPEQQFSTEDFIAFVEATEPKHPRWVWADSNVIYARLHRLGLRVERCYDLRLSRTILRNSSWVAASFSPSAGMSADSVAEISSWDVPPPAPSDALFTVNAVVIGDPFAEFSRQLTVLKSAGTPRWERLRMLLAAESVGSLIAVEMTQAGVPWDIDIHNQILVAELGPRPSQGMRPARLEELAAQIRRLLDSPHLNPDSPKDLLAALNQGGLPVSSTSKWEIQGLKHPVVPVLLDYKRRARMLSANGWSWRDEWVSGGRFRPIYVPGGVVTGRWGADGGGALQLPHFIRPAVVADPGWTFVLSDAAQLEPRVLAAMSGDQAMAQAGQGHDMYEGIKRAANLESRDHAKYGVLGAMYGGTTGVSAQVLPRFRVAFPHAMTMLERAAEAGQTGQTVHTWLGRTSAPGNFGSGTEGEDAQVVADRRQATRSYGRFTRNFIVQGSAAEWALVWMALVRQELFALTRAHGGTRTTDGPHLVFFLHDEILIHTPTELAPAVVEVVRASATLAGELLFGKSPVEFSVSAHINNTYTEPDAQAGPEDA